MKVKPGDDYIAGFSIFQIFSFRPAIISSKRLSPTSDLIPLMDLSAAIYNFIYIFLVLLSCVIVVNTMIMIVKERTKEIGIF